VNFNSWHVNLLLTPFYFDYISISFLSFFCFTILQKYLSINLTLKLVYHDELGKSDSKVIFLTIVLFGFWNFIQNLFMKRKRDMQSRLMKIQYQYIKKMERNYSEPFIIYPNVVYKRLDWENLNSLLKVSILSQIYIWTMFQSWRVWFRNFDFFSYNWDY
jgi:hypothetical protein